jgi:tubulin beta
MEIVNFQVGNCGMKIGTEFFYEFFRERVESGFSDQVFLDSLRPRTVLIDLDKENIAKMKDLQIYQGLDDYFIADNGRAGNWSAGHYTEGQEVLEKIEEITRKLVENCEKLQGFQVFHSAGGCSGGGLGTLIVERLKDLYYEKTLQTVTVFYKEGVDDRITEPYNTVFSMNSLIQFSDVSFVISNESLFKVFKNRLDYGSDVFKSLNQFAAKACLAGLYPVCKRESSFGSLYKYANNLVPFSRLHFLDISFNDKVFWDVDLTDESFSIGSRAAGKFFTCLGICKMRNFREIQSEIKGKIKEKSLSWAKNFKFFNYHVKSDEFFCLTSNGTGLLPLFKGVNKGFEYLFKRKAFVHWYTGEGLDSMEFECAQGNFEDLIEEYQNYDIEGELEDGLKDD